jgi:hypothetical protein
VNPTILNYFGPGGWVYGHVCFDPNSFLWTEGTYTLAVQVTAIVPGAFADTSGYPPTVSIGLDDIGLALKPAATSYYGSTQTNSPKDFQMPTGLNATMVQGMELVINATGASQNTTIYAYAADNSHSIYNPTPWVQIGSAFFKGSGIIDATISLPNAAYYVNATNYVAGPLTNIRDIDVRVNATSPYGPFTLKITVLAIVQTFNQARITVSAPGIHGGLRTGVYLELPICDQLLRGGRPEGLPPRDVHMVARAGLHCDCYGFDGSHVLAFIHESSGLIHPRGETRSQ